MADVPFFQTETRHLNGIPPVIFQRTGTVLLWGKMHIPYQNQRKAFFGNEVKQSPNLEGIP